MSFESPAHINKTEKMKRMMIENLGDEVQILVPSQVCKKEKVQARLEISDTTKREKEKEKESNSKRKKMLKERGGKGIFFGETLENSYRLCQVFLFSFSFSSFYIS